MDLNDHNKTMASCLASFFEQSVDGDPDKIALICDDQRWTYRMLDQEANQLAQYLLQHHFSRHHIIAIFLERSSACYIAILALLKLHITYVPIDTEYPDERVNHIFSDITYNAVITSSKQSSRYAIHFPKLIIIDDIQPQLIQQPNIRPSCCNDTSDGGSCYIIYTSGSTGRPNGVEVTHQSICHYVSVASAVYQMSPQDIVYQGFSLGFDASLEEIWMAFANAATLVVATNKSIRSGLKLAEFLTQHAVTVFSTVPSLLSNVEGNIDSLRLLILGGETCSHKLLEPWTKPGLRILNTYGPTETTVVATYSEYQPNQPITIGQALPGYEVVILDENLHPVADNDEGELCILGHGLAKGYTNPEKTAVKFIQNPHAPQQRLYRSGDLVQKNSEGNLVFLGRIDDQIKLRGFRIELNEIEQVIMTFPTVKQAVVALCDINQPMLVAYLIFNDNKTAQINELKSFLIERLPTFMIPSLFEVVESFSYLASGKINRKQLPQPKSTLGSQAYLAPKTALERDIADVWSAVLGLNKISITDDFFYDLGGHSLKAATVASKLRVKEAFKSMSLADIYAHKTIERLAKNFETKAKQKTQSSTKANQTPSWLYSLCAAGQLIMCFLQQSLTTWPLLIFYWISIALKEQSALWSLQSAAIFLGLIACMPILFMGLGIVLKWTVLGRVKPGQYRLWGWFYFRWWLVTRLSETTLAPVGLSGSPLITVYYRLMGAKIGKNCHISSTQFACHDLITIGNHTSIGENAQLKAYIIEDGWLKLGTIVIGDDCYVGERSVFSINTSMGKQSGLDDISLLVSSDHIPAHQFYSGSPARATTCPNDHIMKTAATEKTPSQTQLFGFGLSHYVLLLFAMTLYYSCYIPGFLILQAIYTATGSLLITLAAAPIAALVFYGLYFFSIIVLKRYLLKKTQPGTYALCSYFFLRQSLLAMLLDINEAYAMADSLYYPKFMQCLGAQIGKKVEMGEIFHPHPDLIKIGDQGVSASYATIGGLSIYHQQVIYAPSTIHKEAFIGNGCLMPPGTDLGEGGLLGCLSLLPINPETSKKHGTWLGSPAIQLPNREKMSQFSEEMTTNPSRRTVCARYIIELFRMVIPSTFILIQAFLLLTLFTFLLAQGTSVIGLFFLLALARAGIILSLVTTFVGMKWSLIGRYKPDTKPLWDLFIRKKDIVEYTYHYFIRSNFMTLLLGTPYAALFLRCLGTKIGKRSVLDTDLFEEFDLIHIGHDVTINSNSTLQTHLYEDRIFKMSTIDIQDNCTIGRASIVLYNTVMEKQSKLGNLSLLMKGETLPTETQWQGSPVQTQP